MNALLLVIILELMVPAGSQDPVINYTAKVKQTSMELCVKLKEQYEKDNVLILCIPIKKVTEV